MKKIFLLFAATVLIFACSKKKEKFELFSAESFAYSLDSGWEMNATVRAKGFEQHEDNNEFTAKLSYSVDLITPEGKLIKGIDSGVVNKTAKEKILELEINIQQKLNAAYKTGNYKVIFNVTDDFSGRKAMLWSFFELSK